jgi:hypothetical protein
MKIWVDFFVSNPEPEPEESDSEMDGGVSRSCCSAPKKLTKDKRENIKDFVRIFVLTKIFLLLPF